MIDLHRLAEALRTSGIKAVVMYGDRVFVQDVPAAPFWFGEEENPALCFAMLDVLEQAGRRTLVGRLPEEYVPRTKFKARLYVAADVPIASYADTRTSAVAELLVAAHESGLLQEGG